MTDKPTPVNRPLTDAERSCLRRAQRLLRLKYPDVVSNFGNMSRLVASLLAFGNQVGLRTARCLHFDLNY